VKKLKFCVCFFIYFTSFCFSQTDYIKWGKQDLDYSFNLPYSKETRDYSYQDKSIVGICLKTTAILYWTAVSDVDGDNCPFHPSCSSYLLEAVSETNIFTGTLMFFDRFTRDANPINKYKYYNRHITGKLYDPVVFNKKAINYKND